MTLLDELIELTEAAASKAGAKTPDRRSHLDMTRALLRLHGQPVRFEYPTDSLCLECRWFGRCEDHPHGVVKALAHPDGSIEIPAQTILTCEACGEDFEWAGKGKRPKGCTEPCRRELANRRKRDARSRAVDSTPLDDNTISHESTLERGQAPASRRRTHARHL